MAWQVSHVDTKGETVLWRGRTWREGSNALMGYLNAWHINNHPSNSQVGDHVLSDSASRVYGELASALWYAARRTPRESVMRGLDTKYNGKIFLVLKRAPQ